MKESWLVQQDDLKRAFPVGFASEQEILLDFMPSVSNFKDY